MFRVSIANSILSTTQRMFQKLKREVNRDAFPPDCVTECPAVVGPFKATNKQCNMNSPWSSEYVKSDLLMRVFELKLEKARGCIQWLGTRTIDRYPAIVIYYS